MNVIIIIVDSFRRDHCGFHGNDWIHTPRLDELAGQSVIFESAFPESLPTLPVRRALHTGLRTFPFRDWVPEKGEGVHSAGWQRIPEDQVTLAEVLRQAGYRTGFITDTYHQFKPSRNYHRGFDQFIFIRGQERDRWRSKSVIKESDLAGLMDEAYWESEDAMLIQYFANAKERRCEEDWLAPQVFRTGMQWLEEHRADEQFFLVIDSFDPHEPWDPPQYYTDLYYPDFEGREFITPKYGKRDYLSDDELRYMRAVYAGECTMVDKWVGHFVDKLDGIGRAGDTLLFFVSDHGHALGEHDIIGKVPWAMYPELVDIPLLMRHPDGGRAGQRVEDFVYNFDIVSTVYEMLDIEPPQPVDGVNLRQVAAGEPSGRQWVTCGFNDYVYCRDRQWAYIAHNDGEDARLWHIAEDPDWRDNVAADHPEKCREMFQRVLEDAGGPLPDYANLRSSLAGDWYRA